MEKDSLFFGDGEDEHMELPPGFRFHPTDEELITHYLTHKVLDSRFFAKAIGEVDLNKVEPWDLPWRAKMGESEWYFFCVRDKKYPTGMRTNRATDAGYWKATGKDREIYRGKSLIGMKKTLVFYKGRAPKGEKSDWVMHEYRLEGKYSPYNLPETAKNEWVISRIFHKGSGGKKTHISGLVGMSGYEGELKPSNLPPLMDCSAHDHGQTRSTPTTDTSHVTCFSSDPSEDKKEDMVDSFRASSKKPCDFSPVSFLLPKVSVQDSLFSTQLFGPNTAESLQFSETALMQYLLQNNEMNMKRYFKSEFSPEAGMSADISSVVSTHGMGQRSSNEDQEDPISSAAGPVDLDCLWNY